MTNHLIVLLLLLCLVLKTKRGAKENLAPSAHFSTPPPSLPRPAARHPQFTDDGDDDDGFDDDKRALKGREAGLVYSLEKPSLSPDNDKLLFNCSAIGKTA